MDDAVVGKFCTTIQFITINCAYLIASYSVAIKVVQEYITKTICNLHGCSVGGVFHGRT